MQRWIGAVAGLGMGILGCTSVKMVQREGCWVRRTEQWPGRVSEELGPCAAPAPAWSDDRVTRAVQECVVRADRRWQTQAQIAWSRGQPVAPTGPEDGVYRACMEEPAKALSGENDQLRHQNDDMKSRLAALEHERDAERARREASEGQRLATQEKIADRLLAGQEKAQDRLFHGQDALAGYLGEAAKKSSQPAVATATATSTSDGAASTEASAPAPVAVIAPGAGTAAAPASAHRPAKARAPTAPAACASPAAKTPVTAAASPSPPAQDGTGTAGASVPAAGAPAPTPGRR